MERITVDSSNLASVGYDEEEKVLEIEFQNGSVWQYFDVPPEVYDELMSAASKGRYFNYNIRDVYEEIPIKPYRRRRR